MIYNMVILFCDLSQAKLMAEISDGTVAECLRTMRSPQK